MVQILPSSDQILDLVTTIDLPAQRREISTNNLKLTDNAIATGGQTGTNTAPANLVKFEQRPWSEFKTGSRRKAKILMKSISYDSFQARQYSDPQ